MAARLLGRSSVGVIELFGVIGASLKVPVYSQILDDVRRNRRFRALIVEIDSPGGTASGSELLYNSLLRVAREKPVVAYIRGTGASGGYYVACAAHKVVALPSTMVGSIGVIYLRPVLQQLLGKLGIDFSVFKGGRHKDMTGFWRSPTPEEEGKFNSLVEEIYDNFVGAVAEGRNLEEAKARELATGEIYSGRRAKELGLVDELGDFDTALDLASQLGRTRHRPTWIRPKRPWMERFAGRIGGPGVSEGLLTEMERLLTGGLYYMAEPFAPNAGQRD